MSRLIFVRRKIVAAPPGGTVTLSHIADGSITTDTSTYTISSVSASAGHLLIGFSTRANVASRSITGVTYDGNACADLITANLQTGSSSDIAAWYIIAVGGATTGNVVISTSANMLRLGYTLLQATGVASTTAYDTDILEDASGSTTASTSVNVPAGGAAVSVYGNASSGGAKTWSGLTEQADAALEATTHRYSTAWDNFASAQTPLSVTATSTSAQFRAMATASLTP